MELERRSIERVDFSQARRGYETHQVDRHLADIAAAVEELKRSQEVERSASTVAGAAADRVKSIVDAAEQSATVIESEARAEAERVTGDATRYARETRAQADSAAATHLAKVEEASKRMLTRADAVETDLNGLVEDLRRAIAAAMDGVRANAKSMGAELAGMKSDLAVARDARGDVPAQPDAAEGEAAVQGDAEHGEGVEEAAASGSEAGRVPVPETTQEAKAAGATATSDATKADGVEGARLVALNMALNGTPRDETARYLDQNFELDDREKVLDEAYARVKS